MKSITKPELVAQIVSKIEGADKRVVESVLNSLRDVTYEQLKNAGAFTIPGIAILTAIHKEATPERQGINPFTKQPTTIKAKPACTKIKCKPVKALKDAV